MFNHQVASTWAPNVSFVNSRYHFMGCSRARAQFNISNKNLTLISTNGGFKKTFADSNVYFQQHQGQILILVLYIDNLYIIGSYTQGIHNLKAQLQTLYKGLLQKILGVEFLQATQGIVLYLTTNSLYYRSTIAG